MNETQLIKLEISNGLARITLSRPEAGNAFSVQACEEYEQVAKAIASAGSDVRAILLSAQGKSFCVGGDVGQMTEAAAGTMSPLIASMVAPLHRGIATLARLNAPLVVAVRGAAAGAGLSLVAGADIVLASKTAKFATAYTGIGLSTDGGATWALPRVIGVRKTTELLLTNRRLSAEEALEWGLVTKLVDDEALDSEALVFAMQLASGPTQAFGSIRRLLSGCLAADLEAQLDAELDAITEVAASDDVVEGVAAFAKRRAPNFQGK